MIATTELVKSAVAEGQDFEWYPTTKRMIDVVKRRIPEDAESIMDIGAGDGRVLGSFAEKCRNAKLFSIEKSTVLVQAQPDCVIPVGTDFYEQNLACLRTDYIFCNPPYSQFEPWAVAIIEAGYAELAFLVIPRRWTDSKAIKQALKRRGASVKAIHSDDFMGADRQSRAVVDIVEIRYPRDNTTYKSPPTDPFDIWFDQNIDTFEEVEEGTLDEWEAGKELARKHSKSSITEMVAAYTEEYQRMEANYRAIFKLDRALLDEMSVSKDAIREGIKKKMAGLKAKYWQVLFGRMDAITSRLTTNTSRRMIEKLTGRTSVAFTAKNAYAIVLWAVKNANRYYDEQLVALFRELSNAESVKNYKSNQKTWQAGTWRYKNEGHDRYSLDYRFVVPRYSAIHRAGDYHYDCQGNLENSCHDLIADIIAVLSNLGFKLWAFRSRDRQWEAGQWEDFEGEGTQGVLFQVKAHLNGNLHFRFMPKAIKRLNIEAGRLLGWLQNIDDGVRELGYPREEIAESFGANAQIAPSGLKLLEATLCAT